MLRGGIEVCGVSDKMFRCDIERSVQENRTPMQGLGDGKGVKHMR
jgi:hypothetical protein